MHHSRARRALTSRLLGVAATVLTLLIVAPTTTYAAPPPSPVNLNRWFGAEAGFEEIGCLGPGVDCAGFGTSSTFGGGVGTRRSMLDHEGPLGPEPWPARSGNRLFMAAVPGGDLGTASLTTIGSHAGPFKGGTLSVGLRVHWLPPVPVVIYQHTGADGGAAIRLTLTVDGSIVASTGGGSLLGITSKKVTTHGWHTLGLTYGPKTDVFRLWLDGGSPQISQTLVEGGPGGQLLIGIVSPTTTPFAIGFDDYVEAGKVDAPIHGARINYLMPHGTLGGTWEKSYPNRDCADAAGTWQMISEDQSVSVPGANCDLGGGGITTTAPGVTEVFTTEGIPSGHVPSSSYHRDVTAQPRAGEAILGVRARLRGRSAGSPVTLTAAILGQGPEIREDMTFGEDSRRFWGQTYPMQDVGVAWTAERLGALRLRIDGGPAAEVQRWVSEARIDYVWVPS